jgi:hypothetical protein
MAERTYNLPFLSLPIAALDRLALTRKAEEIGCLRTDITKGKAS